MIIQTPIIHKRHFGLMMAIYDAMSGSYNQAVKAEREAGDYSRNPLRSAHRELYVQLLNLLSVDFQRRLIELKSRQSQITYLKRDALSPVLLSTNNQLLSRRTFKSPATIYRLLKRLSDASIVTNIYHGVTCNYELVFSPQMVLISDDSNLDYSPVAYILRTSENQIITSCLTSNCKPYDNTKSFKNILIHEQHKASALQQSSKKNQLEHLDWNTGSQRGEESALDATLAQVSAKINEFCEGTATTRAKQPQSGIKNAFGVIINSSAAATKKPDQAPAAHTKINEFANPNTNYTRQLEDKNAAYDARVRRYASIFLSYLITNLYIETGRKVYDGERLNALEVAKKYFSVTARGAVRSCDIQLENLKRRVDIVRRQMDLGKWIPNVGPAWYINPENPSGFGKTSSWLKKDEKFRTLQKFNRLRNTNEAKLRAALENVYRTNSLAVYESGLRYIGKVAPRMVDTYKLQAMSYLELLANDKEVVNY